MVLTTADARRSFDTHNIKEVAHRATAHVRILEDWRRVLPPTLAWNDDDPPATDINVARLRAKYYGSIYVILRPYLRIANHFIDFPPHRCKRTGLSSQLSCADVWRIVQQERAPPG